MASEGLVGQLPKGWEYTTLGEACAKAGGDVQTGPFGSQLHASDYVLDGIPSIMPQNIGDNRVLPASIARITPKDAERLSRYRVQPGDIVYSRRGDVERRALIRASENGWLCGTGCLRVRFGDSRINPLYASYYLGDPRVREWIVRHAHGATMPNLNTSILSALPFAVPPSDEQQSIAHILGTLDDKIELNRRMNETLEAMARELFKSWFVDFDPVRAKAAGHDPNLPKHLADLFPDSFEESELGEIPKEWQVRTIRDLASTVQYGLTTSACTEAVGPKFLRITDIQGGKIDWAQVPYCRVKEQEFERYRLKAHDIVVARTGASTGENIYISSVSNAVFASYLVRFQFDDWRLARLVGAFMRTNNYSEHVANSIGGSAQPNASAQVLAGATLVLPSTSLISAFAELVHPLDIKMRANEKENATLTALRDTLLPKLISGELRSVLQKHVVCTPTPAIKKIPRKASGASDQFKEAILISALVRAMATPQHPLGNFRITKFSYLVHRKASHDVQKEYLKKAAGPYNPRIKYAGPIKIAIANGYVTKATIDKQSGLACSKKISSIDDYLSRYDFAGAIEWVVKEFRYVKNEVLECLTTVDFAAIELKDQGKSVTSEAIAKIIAHTPEWKPKLGKPAFSVKNIEDAFQKMKQYFPETYSSAKA